LTWQSADHIVCCMLECSTHNRTDVNMWAAYMGIRYRLSESVC